MIIIRGSLERMNKAERLNFWPLLLGTLICLVSISYLGKAAGSGHFVETRVFLLLLFACSSCSMKYGSSQQRT